MSEVLNATCSICGKKYHLCRTCQHIESFKPWRTVCDSLQHYAIYLVLAEYAQKKDKNKARTELLKCDLTDYKSFDPEKVKVIDEILKEDKPVKTKPQNIKMNNVVKTYDKKEDIE